MGKKRAWKLRPANSINLLKLFFGLKYDMKFYVNFWSGEKTTWHKYLNFYFEYQKKLGIKMVISLVRGFSYIGEEKRAFLIRKIHFYIRCGFSFVFIYCIMFNSLVFIIIIILILHWSKVKISKQWWVDKIQFSLLKNSIKAKKTTMTKYTCNGAYEFDLCSISRSSSTSTLSNMHTTSITSSIGKFDFSCCCFDCILAGFSFGSVRFFELPALIALQCSRSTSVPYRTEPCYTSRPKKFVSQNNSQFTVHSFSVFVVL